MVVVVVVGVPPCRVHCCKLLNTEMLKLKRWKAETHRGMSVGGMGRKSCWHTQKKNAGNKLTI